MKEVSLIGGMLQGSGVDVKRRYIFTRYKLFSGDGIVLVKGHKQ